MLLLAIATFAATVDSVRIESRWGGLGTPSDTVYKIVRHGERYRRGRAAVSPDAVEHLVSVIEAAPVERQAAIRAIATPEWLAEVAHAPHEYAAGVPACSDEAKQLFERRISDPAFALRVLDSHLRSVHTDDNPFVTVDVALHDGRTLHVESDAQPALMLPWRVNGADTWNPGLPRAIAALLPPGAEPRISGEILASRFVQDAAMEMRYELDEIEERCIHREIVAAVERAFEIVHVYHGSPGTFTAYVRRAGFPPNLVLTLVIRDSEKPGAQAKLDRTLQRLPGYLDVVRGFVAAHGEKSFALWCADGASVNAAEPHFYDKATEAPLKRNAEHAVRLMDWEPHTGYVSHERFILPDGSVLEREDP